MPTQRIATIEFEGGSVTLEYDWDDTGLSFEPDVDGVDVPLIDEQRITVMRVVNDIPLRGGVEREVEASFVPAIGPGAGQINRTRVIRGTTILPKGADIKKVRDISGFSLGVVY